MSSLETYLSHLISVKTESNNKEKNRELIEWIAQHLEQYFTIARFSHNGFSSIVATHPGVKKPKLLLAAHCDVVPGSDGLFSIREVHDKYIGRGVYDMKFAIACFLQFVDEIGEGLKDLDIGIMITSDEEIGGSDGTQFLIEEGYGGEYVFLPDGGGEWSIQDRAKGAFHLFVKAFGSSAHGSRPWEGKSAHRELVHFLKDLQKFFISGEYCHDDMHEHNTIRSINGGHVVNQVSDYAEAQIDIRHTAETSYEDIENYINELLKKYPDIKSETKFYRAPLVTNLNSPDVVLYKRLANEMFGVDMGVMMAHGASDANFFSEAGANVILTRPLGGDPHGEEEWLQKESLQKFYELMKKWAVQVSSAK